MHDRLEDVRFRRPQTSDRAGLVVVGVLIIALAWIGITPAVMPTRE